MGGSIRYLGRTAEYKTHVIGERVKWDFVFEDLKDLRAFLNMGPKDIIFVDDENMRFSQFERDMLSKAHRIYTSRMSHTQDITSTLEFQSAMERAR